MQSTYGLPGTSTLRLDPDAIPTYLHTANDGTARTADHLGFLLGYGASGLPGFPDPNKRHDKDGTNDLRNNAKHIRNWLRSTQRNLGRENLESFLRRELNEKQYKGFTDGLRTLQHNLQNEYYVQQIGEDLSQEILRLLTEVGYGVH